MNDLKYVKKHVLFHCYFCYAVSGMVILLFGVILPDLISENNLSFALAGGLLSFMAIGNLMASIVYPLISARFSKKSSMVALAVIYPVCLAAFTMRPPVWLMYAMMLLIGITKGTITIVNNLAVKVATGSSNKYLNLLHMWYAVGAFSCPLLMSLLVSLGFGWRVCVVALAILTCVMVVSYAVMDFTQIESGAAGEGAGNREADRKLRRESHREPHSRGALDFLRKKTFWVITFLLFFYMGLENCVNGWFVTYLQDSGAMSAALASTMVSITWVMIVLGRLVIAQISDRFSPRLILLVITAMQLGAVVLLVQSRSVTWIVLSLCILGLGMAGTFPTAMSAVGETLGSAPIGVSLLTGISSLGGILTPQVIGVLADHMGIRAAVLFLVINGVFLFACGLLANAKKLKG